MSLDAPSHLDGEIPLCETLPDEHSDLDNGGMDAEDLSVGIESVLRGLVESGKLKEIDIRILKMFFGIG